MLKKQTNKKQWGTQKKILADTFQKMPHAKKTNKQKTVEDSDSEKILADTFQKMPHAKKTNKQKTVGDSELKKILADSEKIVPENATC